MRLDAYPGFASPERDSHGRICGCRNGGAEKEEKNMAKTQNPLQKLNKLQLLELLAQQERELQSLRQQLAEKDELLASRRIVIDEAGSIAEAALKLNHVFEAAQEAAEQYLLSVKYLESRKAASVMQEASTDDDAAV